jgi:membrane associated rhomboid family serine protease
MIPTGTNLERKYMPQATIGLIIANIAIFFCQSLLISSSREIPMFLRFGSGNVGLIGLFTSMFFHADLFHLTFNMLFLWVFGPPLEDRVGKKLFLKYYIGGGVAANIFALVIYALQDNGRNYTSIGASGAVSAIMAIYVYRCYYSKVKMSVTLYLPFTISLPAAPFLILWYFLPEVYQGILSLSTPTNIGHWAHVGGFLFGLVVGRRNRYGHEAAVERYSDKVLKEITEKGGWKDADSEEELLKLLELNPQDPDMHLQLGRYYNENNRELEAEASYRNAIQQYFLANQLYASYVLLEYVETCGATISPHYHLRAGEALTKNGDLEEAYRVIKPFVQATEPGQINEKLHVLFIKLCKALSKEELAESLVRFSQGYPANRYGKELTAALSKKPEELFPRKKTFSAAPIPVKEEETVIREKGALEEFALKAFQKLMDIIVDPLFLNTWILPLSIVYALVPAKLITLSVQLTFLCTALFFTGFYRFFRSNSVRDVEGNSSAKRLRMDLSTAFDNAVRAEQDEDYSRAAEFYEKVLYYDPFMFQARRNLATIYLDRLNDRTNGKKHLHVLMKMAPKDHHYYQYAVEKMNCC